MRSLNLESYVELYLICPTHAALCTALLQPHGLSKITLQWTVKKQLLLQPQCAKCADATQIGNANSNQWYRCHLPFRVHPFSSPPRLRFNSSIRGHGDGGAGARGGGVNGVFQEIWDQPSALAANINQRWILLLNTDAMLLWELLPSNVIIFGTC